MSQSLCTVIQTSAEKAKKDIEQAWKDNNTMVLDNDEIFRQACTLYPHMFGYASERLQFDLAKEMYERDPGSIYQYAAITGNIFQLIRNVKTRGARDLERLKLLYQRLNPRIVNGVWYLDEKDHMHNAEPKGSGKVPDIDMLFSMQFALTLLQVEKRRREFITNTANFDTIVKKWYYNKEWQELRRFFASYEYEFGTSVLGAVAKRVKQVSLERLRILADIKQWKLAQEL